MRRHRPRLILAALLSLAVVPTHAAGLQPEAALTPAITYQGQLKVSGSPANGTYSFRFLCYTDPVANTPIGNLVSVNSLAVSNGLISLPLNLGLAPANGQRVWLDIAVSTDGITYTTLTPRQEITAQFYALHALEAESAIVAGPDSVNSASIQNGSIVDLDIAGNTITGASILNGTIQAIDIASGAITSAKIAANAVTAQEVDPTTVQLRVSGTCAAGSAIQTIGQTGSVTCQTVGAGGSSWSLAGNSGTSATTQFLGTSDNVALVFRTNNVRNGQLLPSTGAATSSGPSVVWGDAGNNVSPGLQAATIGGGGGRDSTGTLVPNLVQGFAGTIGGGQDNSVVGSYGTVSGGRSNSNGTAYSVIAGGQNNTVTTGTGGYGTIGGGSGNTVGNYGAILGGNSNTASGTNSSVGGGFNNTASAQNSTVPGGYSNQAGGTYSFAAGADAHVRNATETGEAATCGGGVFCGDEGTFLWADATNLATNYVSTGPNQFLIRADGGLGFNTTAIATSDDVVLKTKAITGDADFDLVFQTRNGKSGRLYLRDSDSSYFLGTSATGPDFLVTAANGAKLTAGGTWTNGSSRLFKEAFAAVDVESILSRALTLPLSTWRYRNSTEGAHLGPMAEDFAAAFGLGGDDQHIATVDADGVALAAIQGLAARLERDNAALRAANAELAQRLERVESRLALGTVETP